MDSASHSTSDNAGTVVPNSRLAFHQGPLGYDELCEVYMWLAQIAPPATHQYYISHNHVGWIRATHVCRFWRGVGLDMSLLWARNIFTMPSPDTVATFIRRAKNAPLIITIPTFYERSYFDVLLPKVDQIEYLKIEVPSAIRYEQWCSVLCGARWPCLRYLYLARDIEDFDDDVEQENLWSQPPLIAPALEELTLGESFIIPFDAPRLRHLSLRLALDSASVGYAIDTIQSCSTIEHLELHNGFDGLFECSPDQCDIPILSLPHLRYLVMDPCEPHFIYHLQSTRHLNIKISSGSRDSLFCSMANMRLRDLFVYDRLIFNYDTTEFILSSTGQTLVLDREFIAFPEGFHKIIPPHQIRHITVIRNTLSGYEKAIYLVTKSLVSLKIRPTLDSPKLCDIPFLESDDDSSFPSLQTLEIDMTQEGELHAVDRSKHIDWSKGRDRRSKPESRACRLEVIQPELQERLWDAIVHFLSMRSLQTLILSGKRPVVREPRTAAEVKLVTNDTEKLEHIGRLVGEVVDRTESFYVVDLARDADQVRNAGLLVDEGTDLRRMKRWIRHNVGRTY